MGGSSVPGPICSTRVGDDWIDDGTSCRAKSLAPGPVGVATPEKIEFDRVHGYSLAPEARRKRAVDLEVIGGNYSRSGEIRIDSEPYLKKLIAIGSKGRMNVRSAASGHDLQFFIVRGGGEGFLPDAFRRINANNNVTSWTGTDGKAGQTDFDENDLIAVFDAGGTLVGSARLSRPTYVQGRISRSTTRRVYDAWDGKTVSIYRNETPGWIPYLGLSLDDGFRDGTANKGRKVRIDLHKVESTNGCIFIVDPHVDSATLDESALRTFEPELIRKILVARAIDEGKLKGSSVRLGKMRVVTISL